MAGVTPQQIWQALIGAGASSNQAAGIMGNMFYESSWDPEAQAVDSNGAVSSGLVQWNAASYPNSGSLVTGNPARDLAAQIAFLKSTGGFSAASGTSATASGSNFAANYERCVGCQSGGSQNGLRSAKAAAVLAMAQSGKWPQSAGSGGGGGGGTGGVTTAATSAGCAIGNPFSTSLPFLGQVGGPACLISNSNIRAWIGGALLLASGGMGLVGMVVLAAYGLKATGAASKVGGAMEAAGGALLLVPGAEGVGAGLAAGGAGVKKAGKQGAAKTAGKARQSRLAGRETEQRRELGEPRENTSMETRGGTVRENDIERAARRRRERARATRAAGQGRPASREEAGF